MTKSGLLKLTSKLVGIRSEYPNEQEIGMFLLLYLKKAGFEVLTQNISRRRFNILATKGQGKKAVMFYGHLDTVPLSKKSEWETNPFKLTKKDGKLYGLGASDMKGGIAAFLEATKNTNTYVKIFLAVDEENISEGAWKAVQKKSDFFKDVVLVISAEPNLGNGLNSLATGRTGRSLYEINFVGKPEHIIRYRNAVDAIEKLVNFGSVLYSKREKMFKSHTSVAQLRKVEGESVGMSVCGEAKAEVEVLLGHEDSVKNVLAVLKSLTKEEVKVKPRETPYLEGYRFDKFPYQEEIAGVIRKYTGRKIKLYTRKSVGDDNVLATLKIPIITWGADGGNEHKPNEYIESDSLVVLTKMYQEFLHSI